MKKMLLFVFFILFSSQSVFAHWYSCHIESDGARFEFEASSSQEINIYQPLKIRSQASTIEGVFHMTQISEKKYSTTIPSDVFDYMGCNYNDATLIFNLETMHIYVKANCDGTNPFIIYSELAQCIAH